MPYGGTVNVAVEELANVRIAGQGNDCAQPGLLCIDEDLPAVDSGFYLRWEDPGKNKRFVAIIEAAVGKTPTNVKIDRLSRTSWRIFSPEGSKACLSSRGLKGKDKNTTAQYGLFEMNLEIFVECVNDPCS